MNDKKVVSHLDSRHKHMDPANFQEKKPISMMLTQFISSIIYVKKKTKIYQHNILLVHKVDQVHMVLEFQLNIIGQSFHK